MKKITSLLALLVCAVCLTGCMRFNTTITIKKNGKMDFSMLYAVIDMSQYSETEGTTTVLTPEQKQEYIEKGWDVEDYTTDGFVGFILSKKDVELDDANSTMNQTSENTNQGGKFEIERNGSKYTLKWQVFTDEDSSNMAQASQYFTQFGGYMKFTLNLPVKPVSSNATATSNNGKTLEWDLLNLGPDQTIEVTFSLLDVKLIIIIAVVALLVIAIVTVVIILLVRRKKRSSIPVLKSGSDTVTYPSDWGTQDENINV